MRIIAAVTLIFLPGTFVATIFSTGLFDWGSDDPTPAGSDDGEANGGGKLVSKYLWVYFMLTGVLTAVVLVGWGVFSYVQKGKMTRLLSLDADTEWGVESKTWVGEKRRGTERTMVDGGRDKAWLNTFQRWTWLGKQRQDDHADEDTKIA
jgi:hypothetical protein